MSSEPVEIVTRTSASERGALITAAGALVVLAAAGAFRPELLVRILGAEPAPDLLALLSFGATMPAGAELGRRAVRLRGDTEGRRRRLILWTFLAYVVSVTFGAAAVRIAAVGPDALAEPFLLAAQGLVVAVLLLPWGAVPIAATAMVLERWTRPSPPGRTPPGGGSGPGPGTRAPGPVIRLADARRPEAPQVRKAA